MAVFILAVGAACFLGLGFVLQQGFTWVLVTGPFFHGPTWWPLVPAVSVVPLVTFWLNRHWAFA